MIFWSMTRSTATLQKPETKYDKNYYNSTMKVFERRKNISRLACKYLSLINDVVERNNPDLERMLDLHQKIFNLNEENGYHFEEKWQNSVDLLVDFVFLNFLSSISTRETQCKTPDIPVLTSRNTQRDTQNTWHQQKYDKCPMCCR